MAAGAGVLLGTRPRSAASAEIGGPVAGQAATLGGVGGDVRGLLNNSGTPGLHVSYGFRLRAAGDRREDRPYGGDRDAAAADG